MTSSRHILVLTYWPYNDALVQTYTLPYLGILGKQLPESSVIHLVTLEPNGTLLKPVHHPGIRHHPYRYVPFGLKGTIATIILLLKLARLILVHGIDTIHAWCTPAGMLGYILAVATGKRLVVDSLEPHAEAMVENGTWKRNGMAFKVLFRFERLQTRKAEAVIAAAPGMEGYAKSKYGVVPKRFFVKPACVDLNLFSARNRKSPVLLKKYGLEGKIVCVYAGKFGGIYQDREIFRFFRACSDHWGGRFHVLLLTSHDMLKLRPFMEAEGLSTEMFTLQWAPHQEIPDLMGLGDFGITPVKPVPSKRFCSPIKNGEYWALGLPVVITPGISEDSRIIQEHDAGVVIRGSDEATSDLAVSELDHLLTSHTRDELYDRIRPLAEKYRNFRIAEEVYREVYGKH